MHLPSPIPAHDLVTIVHHSIVDTAAVACNTLLLLAIILRSPSTLGSYKVLLVNSATLDLLGSFSMLMSMVRITPARHAMAYVYDGPCAYVSGTLCHCFYSVMCATQSQSHVLGKPTPSNVSVSLVCFIVSIPNLMIFVLFMFALDDPDDVRAQLRAVRPEYDLDDYVLGGSFKIPDTTVS